MTTCIVYTTGCLACVNKAQYKSIKEWCRLHNCNPIFRNVFLDQGWLKESYVILKHHKLAKYPLITINGNLIEI